MEAAREAGISDDDRAKPKQLCAAKSAGQWDEGRGWEYPYYQALTGVRTFAECTLVRDRRTHRSALGPADCEFAVGCLLAARTGRMLRPLYQYDGIARVTLTSSSMQAAGEEVLEAPQVSSVGVLPTQPALSRRGSRAPRH